MKPTGYRFLDKDPCIDVYREARRRTGKTPTQIHGEGGPTPQTQRKWDTGDTKKPQHLSFTAAMQAMGGKEVWQFPDFNLRVSYKYPKERKRKGPRK